MGDVDPKKVGARNERSEKKASTITRRQALKSMAAATFVGWISPARAEIDPNSITTEYLAQADWLSGMDFTEPELELMLNGARDLATGFARIREIPLDNSVAPAVHFEPTPGRQFLPDPGSPGTSAPPPSRTLPKSTGNPGSEEDVAFASIRSLAGWLGAGKISSRELTELYLRRLTTYDPDLECVIEMTGELALRQADAADARRAREDGSSPLLGIPWGAKDLLAHPETRTTWGAKPFQTQQLDTKATVADRLEQAGAPLLAKLSVGALAWGDVWFGGTTKNPWNLEQGSSGSSAGPAAATAAGLVGFSIGTETWGSIISPSTRCGVTGLRPTFGRVSRQGVMALSWSMDKIGPIARSVEDCAWVFEAIAGPDGLDATVRAHPFDWPEARPLTELRIGVVRELFDEDRSAGIEDEEARNHAAEWQQFDQASLQVLQDLGANLVDIKLPGDIPIEPLSLILTAEASTAFDELTRSGRDEELVRQEEYAWPNVFRQGQLIPAVEYLRANRLRTLLQQQMETLFESIDLFVAPSFGGDHLLLTNLTGHPSVVVPNGFREDGTPTSLTFTGRLFGEGMLLSAAQAYQEATDFHLRRPPLGG